MYPRCRFKVIRIIATAAVHKFTMNDDQFVGPQVAPTSWPSMSEFDFGVASEEGNYQGESASDTVSLAGGSASSCVSTATGLSSVSGQQKTCIACPMPRVNDKSRFCKSHKACQKTMDAQVNKKGVPQEVVQAHREAMANDVSAALKVRDFMEKNPPKGHGQSRGMYDHVSFLQTYKATNYTNKEVQYKRMDFIEYSKLQERERGWNVAKSLVQWKVFEADPSVCRDYEGKEEGHELRLDCPLGLFTTKGTGLMESKAPRQCVTEACGLPCLLLALTSSRAHAQ